ncbi:MAG: cytidylate kinase family protein [Candidatus Bathyarchaeota archaeon]
MAKESMAICVCGMAGSGKSTIAKRLARRYALKYFSGGDILKTLASQEGFKPAKRGWWESKEGIHFLEKRTADSKFDKTVDEKLLELAKQGNVVLDSWTMPWLLKCGFKIWLEASREKRALRIAERDRITVGDAFEALKKKEEKTKKIYKRLYNFNLGKDFTPFHLIVDTEHLNKEEIFHIICKVLDSPFVKSCKI